MSVPLRWYAVALRAPDRAPRLVTIRARRPEIAERIAEQRHDGYRTAESWRIKARDRWIATGEPAP